MTVSVNNRLCGLSESVFYDATSNGISTTSDDNLSKIESLITTISNTGGGVLYLPYGSNGIYKVSSGFTIKDNVTLSADPGVFIENQDNTADADAYTVKIDPGGAIDGINFKHLSTATSWTGAEIYLDGRIDSADGTSWDTFRRSNNLYEKRTYINNVNIIGTGGTSTALGSGIRMNAKYAGSAVQFISTRHLFIRGVKYGVFLETSGEPAPTDFDPADVNTTNGQLTVTSHGLITDSKITFTTSAADLPAGLSTGVDYYVTVIDANTITVSATLNGAAIVPTDQGTGTHTVNPVFCFVNGNTFDDMRFMDVEFQYYLNRASTTEAISGNIFTNSQVQASAVTERFIRCDGDLNVWRTCHIFDWNTAQDGNGLNGSMIEWERGTSNHADMMGAGAIDPDTNVTGTFVNWNNVEVTGKSIGARRLYNVTNVTSNLNPADHTGMVVYVSNGAAGNPILAFSDGTNWLRCDTLAAISAV